MDYFLHSSLKAQQQNVTTHLHVFNMCLVKQGREHLYGFYWHSRSMIVESLILDSDSLY